MRRSRSRTSSSRKKLSAEPPDEVAGRCLCGGVSVILPHPVHDVGVCHCRICRRWTSGPWMALQVPEARVSGDSLEIFRSSSVAERGFCRTCGAHIFHRPAAGPELAVSAGLFNDPEQFIDREIFVEFQPPHYAFANRGKRRTTASMALEWLPKMAWRHLKAFFGARG
ncbi:MAG: GFA family protein [Sphingopyxis solisilvae]|uniref:GFA family protein n=1 Tax=Sphingopyxis solisilvae TaxID=1886788 RepID=UPI0040369428